MLFDSPLIAILEFKSSKHLKKRYTLLHLLSFILVTHNKTKLL